MASANGQLSAQTRRQDDEIYTFKVGFPGKDKPKQMIDANWSKLRLVFGSSMNKRVDEMRNKDPSQIVRIKECEPHIFQMFIDLSLEKLDLKTMSLDDRIKLALTAEKFGNRFLQRSPRFVDLRTPNNGYGAGFLYNCKEKVLIPSAFGLFPQGKYTLPIDIRNQYKAFGY